MLLAASSVPAALRWPQSDLSARSAARTHTQQASHASSEVTAAGLLGDIHSVRSSGLQMKTETRIVLNV